MPLHQFSANKPKEVQWAHVCLIVKMWRWFNKSFHIMYALLDAKTEFFLESGIIKIEC